MKIGIVGTGNISSRHLDEFNNLPNVNVEAVCDTNQKNLEKDIHNPREINIIAEIGINHNGSIDKAIYLADKAIAVSYTHLTLPTKRIV